MANRPPYPPRPPPPPGNPYANGVGNATGNAPGSVDQAQTALAAMNLNPSHHAPSSASASAGAGRSSMPMPPPPAPMPPPPGRAVPSTSGRAVSQIRPPPAVGSMPLPPTPSRPMPPAPSGAPSAVPATPSRGMPPPPSISGLPSHPPSSMQTPRRAQAPPPSAGSAPMRPPMAPPMPSHTPTPSQTQQSAMPPPPRPQMTQQTGQMQQPPQQGGQSHVPPPSPYRQTMQQSLPPSMPMPSRPPLPSMGPPPQMQQARPPPMPPRPGYPQPPPPGPPVQQLQQRHDYPPGQYNQHQQMQQHGPPGQPPMPQHSGYPQPPPPGQPLQHSHPPPGPPQQQHYPHQQHPPHPTNPALKETSRIDPSQIPRIPLFTRPHHAPATIYPSFGNVHAASTNAQSTAMSSSSTVAGLPPPSDSRYVTSAEYENVSPRIMRSTVHAFPLDGATSRKCDIPLGLVINPLAGLSSLCDGGNASESDVGAAMNGGSSTQWNGREQGDIYGNAPARTGTPSEADYVPYTSDDVADPERVPVIREPKKQLDKETGSYTRALTPPRCDRCQAYLNPFCTPVNTFSIRGAYAPTQYYSCNLCGSSGSIALKEEYIANGTFDAATRCGTVEYEVGGAYCVRKEGPVQNVHLYGVEYIPPDRQNQSDHHHHGTVKSHGWYEALDAIREVGRGLSKTAPRKEDKEGRLVSDVRIGLFAFCRGMLVFPYLKRRKAPKRAASWNDDGFAEPPSPRRQLLEEQHFEQDVEEAELAVAIVSDVSEDPFCPIPLHMWTHNVGAGIDSDEWKRFCRILDSFTELIEQLLPNEAPSSAPNSPQPDPWTLNCGGAALAALADALKDSGGKGTLITTRRPNYGVGALRDRESVGPGQQSPYKRATDELRVFTPLQRLVKLPVDSSANDAESRDSKAGLFYRQLGEQCAASRACLDIVVTSSLVTLQPVPPSQLGPKSVHPNIREFLDVATLAELCRATCGKFKWLRVGNECGVRVGDSDGQERNNDSFTAEQLREELKRSALAYMGSDAVFKLRCSDGVRFKSYCPTLPMGTIVGDGIVDSAELELSSIHSGTSIAVLLEHKVGGVVDTRGGRKGIDVPQVFFQSAVLYTTLTGSRRVRVSTMGLVTTKVPADVFRSADLGTVATVMTRQAITDLELPHEGSLHCARTNVFQKCVSILANYRMYTTARASPAGQLILPESLQLLPLFCLSLRKSRLFRNSNIPFKAPFPTADERAYHIFYGRMVSPNMSLQIVHPNLFDISDMRTRDGEWITPPSLQTNKYAGQDVVAASTKPVCQLPKATNPSIACLDERRMYLLDDRFAFYLFVGKDVPEETWRELLAASTPPGTHRVNEQWVSNVPLGQLALSSTEASHKLRSILQQLRALNSPNPTLAMTARPTHAPLILVFVGRGSVFEEEMDSLLVDDPVEGGEKGYVDFLCGVHREVRQMSSEN